MKPITYGLENCYIFKDISVDRIDHLLSHLHFTIKTYDKHAIIFSPNHDSSTLAIVLSGQLEIQKIKMSGEHIIVATKGAYDIIAAPSVFSSKPNYAGTVIATQKSQLMIIEKNELTRILMMDKNVMHCFLEFISNQVIFMNDRLELISHGTLKKKIIAYLLSEHHKTKCTTIQIPYSKKKWADYLNAQPPSISRTLSELENQGYIQVHKRQISILQLSELHGALL